MGGLIQRRVTAHTGIWKVFFLSLHFLRDTILVFHRHLSSSNYFLPTCPSWYQLLASLFSAATFHHVLWARGESKRRIMQRRVPVRAREREREWTRDKSDRARASSFLLRPRGGVLVATVRVWESSTFGFPSLSERSAGWVASLMLQHFLNNNSRYNRIKRIDSHFSKFRTDDLTIQRGTHKRTFVHPTSVCVSAYCVL